MLITVCEILLPAQAALAASQLRVYRDRFAAAGPFCAAHSRACVFVWVLVK
jgi:hypothetical protein